ncbi:MAG: adenylate/guanylate cyclase domain-containing protein [Elusimicrobiota bacterium]
MKLFKTKLPKWIPGLLISLLVTFFILLLYIFHILDRYELNASDMRYSLRDWKTLTCPVKLVTIDDTSLQTIGKWPWRRSIHADLINILSEYEPASIMFDILFMEPDTERPEDDLALFNATKKAGNVYYPFYFSLGEQNIIPKNNFFQYGIKNEQYENFIPLDVITLPLEGLLNTLKGTGYADGSPDEDGVIRKAPLFARYRDTDRIYPLISFRLACDFLGVKFDETEFIDDKYVLLRFEDTKKTPLKIPVDSHCQMIVNYASGEEGISTYPYELILKSYNQIKNGEEPLIDLTDLKNSIVLVGQTATGTVDANPIPLFPSYPMVGVHISILDTIISGQFIRESETSHDILLLLFLGILMGFIIPKLSPVRGIIFTLLILIIYVAVNYSLFANYGICFHIVYPSLVIFLCDLSVVIYKYATEEQEKKMIKNVFSTYMTPSVVTKILKNPDSLKLGGERREMTVYFSDLSGFTTISESLSPEDLVHLINEYLEAMTNIIFKYEGTLDKYEGDAIMAFWNAPVDQPDHALRCCKAALDCFEELARLQEKWLAEDRPPLNMRIGINTGNMIVGNMGSNTRMDYTVMGDSVNLGARLESANKEYGTRLMISEFTKAHVENEVELRELDALKVKGKTKPVHVYELMALKGELPEEKQKAIRLFKQGILLYKGRKWDESIIMFNSVLKVIPDDGPSRTYLARCNEYKNNPPDGNWDGVWELKTK